MIRIYGVKLCNLQENGLLQSLPDRIALPWKARHPKLRNKGARLASLAGVWLLYKSGAEGTLAYTENGKPYLTAPDRAISITHTQTHAFCAISDSDGEIGLDAEDLGRLTAKETAALAARWFTASERAELEKSLTEEAFLSIWTRKEAQVKQSGEGLRAIRTTDVSDSTFVTYRIENTLITLVSSEPTVPSEIEML
ncbi:MAG: 4'-phosphopantetheinyl transferase superfamily protein [Clostridia bacterium]|nr:4'-phosphopantetheinyl transferase superfamily protein [Clostridia bacterium]